MLLNTMSLYELQIISFVLLCFAQNINLYNDIIYPAKTLTIKKCF